MNHSTRNHGAGALTAKTFTVRNMLCWDPDGEKKSR